MSKAKDNKSNHESDKYTTESTFEVYKDSNPDEPVTNSILESYGQVGISNEREEKERKQPNKE
jgi:hypothetical protein